MSPKTKPGKHLVVTYGKDGSVESVSVSTPLEIVYGSMFERAQCSFRAKPSDMENGIQVIVFGCFWLEARTNNVTIEFLWRSLGPNPIRELFWQQLKKSSIMEKLKIIGALCTVQEADQLRLLTPRIRNTFELRNRLAHFRAEEEPVADGPKTAEQLVGLLEALPETELVSLLTTAAVINEHSAALRDGANWLESVRSSKTAAQHSV